jgi:ribose transport system substrate-binding protein
VRSDTASLFGFDLRVIWEDYGMKHRRQYIAAVLALTSATSLAGGPSSAEDTAAGKPFAVMTPEGFPGDLPPNERKLVVYDRATATFRSVPGDASSYTPDTSRTVAAGTVLAYGDGQASIPFAAATDKTLYPLAKKMGFDLRYCDLNLDPQKALTCASAFVAQQPTVAVIENWQAAVADQMMAVYNAAHIPVITVDLPHPNAVFFGADSFQSGLAAGQAAGNYAKAQWQCKDIWIYLASNPSEGARVDLRLVGYADGIQSICGTVPASNIVRVIMDQGSEDQAVSKTTDWLTANPQAKHILATSVDQLEPGLNKAFTQNDRDGWSVQQSCDDNAVSALASGPTSETHWIGCIAYRPDAYPQYFLSLAADVAAGKPVPTEVNFPLKLYTHDNISALP